jgi:hypothetical protein
MEQVLGFGIVIALGLAIWSLSLYLAKRRRDSIEKFAHSLGMSFEAGPFESEYITNVHFPLFTRGRAQKVLNVVRTTINSREFTLFDYRYTTGAGKNKKSYFHTVIHTAVHHKLPTFTLGKETIFSKIAQSVGYQDIDIPEDREFSKLFVIRGEFEDAIRNCFTSDIRELLKNFPKVTLESQQGEILWYLQKEVPAEQCNDFLSQAELLARTLSKQ